MITKLAFLSRILPGLFRRLPTVTSAGYTMPRERFFFFGVSFSALVHAAVLFGINPPRPLPVDPIGLELKPTPPIGWTLIETPPPPVEEETEEKPEEKNVAENDAGSEERATIGTTFSHATEHAIIVTVDKIVPPVRPDPNRKSWTVPKGPPKSGHAAKATRYNPKDLDKVPVIASSTAPRYPFEMKREGRTGTVVLRFVVDSRGEVLEVEVISSPHEGFSKAAVEAMLRWKFRPGMKNGRKVDTRMEMPMAFSLEKSS